MNSNPDHNIGVIQMSNPETQTPEAPPPEVIFAQSGSIENSTELVQQQQAHLEQHQQPTEVDHSATTPQAQQQVLPDLQGGPSQDTLQEFAMQLQAQTVPHQEDPGQQEDPNREDTSGVDAGTPPGSVNNRNKPYRTVAPLPTTPVPTISTPIPQTPLIMVLPPQTLPQNGGAAQQPQYFLQLAQPQQPGQQQQQTAQQQQQPLQAAFSLPIQFALPGQNQMAPHPFFAFAGQQGGQAIQIQLAPGANGATAAIPINAALGDGRPGTLPLPALRFAQHDGKGRSAQNALYPCPHPGCDKSFYRKQNLQSHARCHSGDYAFSLVIAEEHQGY
ncbi:hypothetical protein HK097_001799 [Rhizophlyctis rosea]|uniref:C2H2-type domain-containing protein n=1 Tax=Rhizophlyctis rosea TaxID=64517 RepID=A0AAD5X4B3_9FUNG|nr:hypothetical protein HK097_001799 [Rhizophlyctis rosea]